MRHLVRQGLRFGVVGAVSTITHVGVFILCIEAFGTQPILANIPAFVVALVVGFTGHFSWTFPKSTNASSAHARLRALVRFAAVAGIGLALNATVVFSIVNVWGLPYLYAVALMVTLVPILLFFLNRHWAFA